MVVGNWSRFSGYGSGGHVLMRACPIKKGARIKLRDRHGGDWREWPEGLRRREVPGVDRRYSRG